jgi:hypothetical protein
MFNNYPFYPYTYSQPSQNGYKVLPVAREEEALAVLPDYQGTPLFFYNKGKNEIYIKKFDEMTAEVAFQKFVLVTQEEKPKQNDTSKLEMEIEQIKNQLEQILKPKANKKEQKDDVLQ